MYLFFQARLKHISKDIPKLDNDALKKPIRDRFTDPALLDEVQVLNYIAVESELDDEEHYFSWEEAVAGSIVELATGVGEGRGEPGGRDGKG